MDFPAFFNYFREESRRSFINGIIKCLLVKMMSPENLHRFFECIRFSDDKIRNRNAYRMIFLKFRHLLLHICIKSPFYSVFTRCKAMPVIQTATFFLKFRRSIFRPDGFQKFRRKRPTARRAAESASSGKRRRQNCA